MVPVKRKPRFRVVKVGRWLSIESDKTGKWREVMTGLDERDIERQKRNGIKFMKRSAA